MLEKNIACEFLGILKIFGEFYGELLNLLNDITTSVDLADKGGFLILCEFYTVVFGKWFGWYGGVIILGIVQICIMIFENWFGRRRGGA